MHTNVDHEPMLTKARHREPRTSAKFCPGPSKNGRRGDNPKYRNKK